MSKISLELRHSWQEDPEFLHVHLMEPRQRCGLACLEMVIEFHHGMHIDARDIVSRAENNQAVNQHNDWWHPGQVRVLGSYGLIAWRRNWTAPTQNPQYFADHEGYSDSQMQAVSNQIESEFGMNSDADRLLAALNTSLENGNPVIVSVKAGFSDNKENHQVVISGRNADAHTYEIHDPVQKSGPNCVTDDHLLRHVNFWAIFAQKI